MKNMIVIAGTLLLITSCANISSFQTARTTPKDQGEFGVSLDIAGISGSFEDNTSVALPNLSLWGRYGAGEKTDFGIKINSSLNILMDVKQQVVGDQNSKFAFALGGGIGLLPIGKLFLQYHVPLYLSFHPRENFAWYVTPRYIHQFSTNYFGSSIGIMFGRKVKFAFDISYSGSLNDPDSIIDEDINLGTGLFNIGWGVKIPIK